MENKKIDIIIPLYNQKEFLARSLSSILSQSIVNKIDVTIIDDNSTESYDEIISFFQNYISIFVIKLNQNRGPGFARQMGLNITHNDFIVFLDADDIFENCYSLEFLYNQIIQKDAPAIFSSFVEENSKFNKIPHIKDSTWLFGKIYSRKFLDKYNITFNDSRSNEDKGFNCAVILCSQKESNKIFFIDKVTYVWKWNKNSITRINNFEYKKKDLWGFVDNTLYALNIAKENNVNQEILQNQSSLTMIYLYFRYLANQKDNSYSNDDYLKITNKFYNNSYKYFNINLSSNIFQSNYQSQYNNFYNKKLITKEDVEKISYESFLKLINN